MFLTYCSPGLGVVGGAGGGVATRAWGIDDGGCVAAQRPPVGESTITARFAPVMGAATRPIGATESARAFIFMVFGDGSCLWRI